MGPLQKKKLKFRRLLACDSIKDLNDVCLVEASVDEAVSTNMDVSVEAEDQPRREK